MARSRHDFSFALTLSAFLLDRLHKSWHDLLPNFYVALASALGAGFDVVGVVATAAAAVRADGLTRVGQLEVFPFVEFLKRRSDLQLDAGAYLFILSTTLMAKNVSEWVVAAPVILSCFCFLFVLNRFFLSESVEIFAPFRV